MTSIIDKYLAAEEVGQILLVEPAGGSTGKLSLFEKKDGSWKLSYKEEVLIGREGMGKIREGDMKTPVGDFGIITAFGIKDNPGTSLPYLKVDGALYCCGEEGPEYNRFVCHPCDGEHMADYEPEYNYGIFPDYNKDGIYPRGSAIFVHVKGSKPYTAGCIAVSEEGMVQILKTLTPGARVISVLV